VGPLQFRQFAKQAVLVRVRVFRFGFDVIEVVVAPDLIPQGNESSLEVCHRHGIEKKDSELDVPKGKMTP